MTAHALASPHRRGACPGLSAPMTTGDGLLVRLLPIGTMPLAAFGALCAAARRHGNGVIEITSRGSVQVRGLSAQSAPDFAACVGELGIAAQDGIPVHCNPLSGLAAGEIIAADAIVGELRHILAQRQMAARVSAKVSVAIDSGGTLRLARLPADIWLDAQKIDGAVVLDVSIGGDAASAVPLGSIAPAHGVEAALRLLDVIARHGREARARDIVAMHGIAPFQSAIADRLLSARPRTSGNERSEPVIGAYPLHGGGLACGIGLAFGHANADALERLAEAAAATGADGLRAAPDRALFAVGLTPQTAPIFIAAAARLGFITRADDPRRHIVACAGAPICASAYIASRTLAPLAAEKIAALRDDDFTVHISGCSKGCAQAAPAALTVIGTAEGCALVANGSTRDQPFAMVRAGELPDAIAHHARKKVAEADHV